MGPVSRVNDPTCHRDRRGRRFDWREARRRRRCGAWRRSLLDLACARRPCSRAALASRAAGTSEAGPGRAGRRRGRPGWPVATPQPLTHVRVVAASPALRAAAFAAPAHRQSGEARTSPSTSAGERSIIGWALPRRPRRPCSPPRREPEHRYCRRRRGKRRRFAPAPARAAGRSIVVWRPQRNRATARCDDAPRRLQWRSAVQSVRR